jgi:predicted nuclease of predicted toxin-antitoxin system
VDEPLRFYFDQHMHGGVATGLRLHGVDVLTAQEAGRCSQPDVDQLAFAGAQERVLVTHDTDYLALVASGVDHAGIAWADATKYTNLVGPLIQALLLLHGVLEREDMKNRVEYL